MEVEARVRYERVVGRSVVVSCGLFSGVDVGGHHLVRIYSS